MKWKFLSINYLLWPLNFLEHEDEKLLRPPLNNWRRSWLYIFLIWMENCKIVPSSSMTLITSFLKEAAQTWNVKIQNWTEKSDWIIMIIFFAKLGLSKSAQTWSDMIRWIFMNLLPRRRPNQSDGQLQKMNGFKFGKLGWRTPAEQKWPNDCLL